MDKNIFHSAFATLVSLVGLAAIAVAVAHTVLVESRPSLASAQSDSTAPDPAKIKSSTGREQVAAPVLSVYPAAPQTSEILSTLPVAAKRCQRAHNLAADGTTLLPSSD